MMILLLLLLNNTSNTYSYSNSKKYYKYKFSLDVARVDGFWSLQLWWWGLKLFSTFWDYKILYTQQLYCICAVLCPVILSSIKLCAVCIVTMQWHQCCRVCAHCVSVKANSACYSYPIKQIKKYRLIKKILVKNLVKKFFMKKI